MKILFVCKSLPPSVIGGIQTHTWKLSEWLVKLGHEVTILTAGSWRKGMRQFKSEGRNILEIPYFPGRRMPFFSILAEELAFNLAARRWLNKHSHDFDLVHLQGRSGFCFSGEQNKTPLVATFHGLVSIENDRSGKNKSRRLSTMIHEKWATFFEMKTLQHADACIAVSQEMLQKMELSAPGVQTRSSILPNGVDIQDASDLHTSNEHDRKQLLFVGRMDRIKGIFHLVKAMKYVHEDIHLTMVGDGPERKALEQKIEKMNLQDRITFTGALPSKQVFEKIESSFALVLPSFHETQGIVLLEANACGKPVIASDIPGIREVVIPDKTGILTPVGDPITLSEAINDLYSDPAKAEQMGQAGRQHVAEHFSWENIALQTERLYGQVLAQKSLQPTSASIAKNETPNSIAESGLITKFI